VPLLYGANPKGVFSEKEEVLALKKFSMNIQLTHKKCTLLDEDVKHFDEANTTLHIKCVALEIQHYFISVKKGLQ
jgi:hypothetical protein